MGEFTMPSLGADMDRGTLSEWLVAEGDHVTRGDIVAVIQTDKSDVEVEVFESGVMAELLVEPGTQVEVGTPLARIEAGDHTSPAAAPPSEPTPKPEPQPKPKPQPTPEPPVRAGAPSARASVVLSPVVRHLAAELHVDTTTLHGTGPGGRITRHDVEAAGERPPGRRSSPYARRRAAEQGTDLALVAGTGPGGAIRARDLPAAAPPAAAPDRQQTMRSAIARLMTASNRDIPHYHVISDVDVAAALDWLDDRNAGRPPGERILPAAMFLRATAVALAHVPELNGWWRDDAFVPSPTVDIGVAVSLRGGGLVTPTIAGVDALDLAGTMAELRAAVGRARHGRLRGHDLAEASVTVTNLGDQGAEAVLGLIHPPQVALVGLGRVVDRPSVVDGAVVVRRGLTATLSGDHRATDGHAGSRFLAAFDAALARPDQL